MTKHAPPSPPVAPALPLRLPAPETFPALRELWRACFDDPEPIANLFFDRLIRPENTRLLADEAGRPLAMLFIQPARLQVLDGPPAGVWQPNCAYIYGVATRPDQRGRGLSSRLLEETARDLGARGLNGHKTVALALVPSGPKLVGYYARLGFSPAFSHRVITLTGEALEKLAAAAPPCRLTPARLADLYDLREQSLAGLPLALHWDRGFLDLIDRECRLYQGETLRFESGGRAGYLVYYRDEQGILIKECLEAGAPTDEPLLPGVMAALHRRLGAARYTLRLRPDGPDLPAPFRGEPLPFGMLRWLDGPPGGFAARSPGYLAHALD